MCIKLVCSAALAFSIGCSASAWSAERPRVEVDCKPTDKKLIYDCSFVVNGRKTGIAMEGAEFRVSADMPSMPMAHNIRPITPKATSAPGTYTGRLHLEMNGAWALKLTFSKPVRDVVIKKIVFGSKVHQHNNIDHSKHDTHSGSRKVKK